MAAHTCHGDRFSRWVHNCLIVQACRSQTWFLFTVPDYLKPAVVRSVLLSVGFPPMPSGCEAEESGSSSTLSGSALVLALYEAACRGQLTANLFSLDVLQLYNLEVFLREYN